jgi:hypothetical protein
MAKAKPRKTDGSEYLVRRLDAIIRLLLEIMYGMKVLKFNQTNAARTLKSVGLSPTEIATIFGKKSREDVSQYLYGKKHAKSRR